MMELRADNQRMRNERANLLEDCERHKVEYDSLLGDFEECKTQLFKWQTPVQTSDDSMQKTLEKIHRAIDGWVYDATVHADDNLLYGRCMKEHHNLQKQQRCTKFEAFIKISAVQTWGPYSCSNFWILSLIVQWILNEYVFREPYPLTISPVHARAVGDLENAMRAATQSKGQYRPGRFSGGNPLITL